MCLSCVRVRVCVLAVCFGKDTAFVGCVKATVLQSVSFVRVRVCFGCVKAKACVWMCQS